MKKWHDMNHSDVLDYLKTDKLKGLIKEDVLKRQEEHGKNEFSKPEKNSLMKEILHQLSDISVIILLLAAILSLSMALRNGEGFIEPIVIFSIILMNIILAITQERSAEKALEALAGLNSPDCIVLRNGIQEKIETSEIVAGDIVILKSGDMVPADARLLESTDLSVDESTLTGESEPSEKDANLILDEKAIIGDQLNMVFSGCLVTAGHGTAVVTSIGMDTQMGKIASYLNNSQKIITPLQKRLNKVVKSISTMAILSAVFLLVLGILQGEELWYMVMLAVTLAVAAVPETLNLIVTLSLAHGVKNMVDKNALIRKLKAVETLGNTSVICSDKTGTLTQNKMSIRRLWMPGEPIFGVPDEFTEAQNEFLHMLAMVSNAKVEQAADGSLQIFGDPTETAIMRLLSEKEFTKDIIAEPYQKAGEIPFSSERKMMTVVLKDPADGYIVLTKGALDRLPLKFKEEKEREEVKEVHDSFASDALRVIALGIRHISVLPEKLEDVENELTLYGIIGLIDPPRPEAALAVENAKKAGIRTVMITGDHAVTAGAIARDLGILKESEKVMTGQQLSEMTDDELCENIRQFSVYARVSPEDKIRIVEAWQENGEVVSMTGDGVNDAPALKAADVGISMGQNGTEVAKNASDMVLTDDNFATIIDAVAEGRSVYSNIRKTIYFLLVCNISEIIIMLIAQMKGWGIPVTPVMLLLVNVFGDGIPGLQLAKETSDPRIMKRGPIRRDESFFGGGLLRVIIQQTIACSAVVLAGYYIGNFVSLSGMPAPSQGVGQTMAFLILGWTSILHIFTVRSRKSIFRRTLRDNPPLVISAAVMIAVFSFLAAVPAVGGIFDLKAIGMIHWLIAIGLSFVPTIAAELIKIFDNHTRIKEIHAYDTRIVRHRIEEDDNL